MFMNEAAVSYLLKDPNQNGGNTAAIDKAKTDTSVSLFG